MKRNYTIGLLFGLLFMLLIVTTGVFLAMPVLLVVMIGVTLLFSGEKTLFRMLSNQHGFASAIADAAGGKLFKRPLIRQVVVSDMAVNLNAMTPPIKESWPLGEGWYKIKLVFKNTIVIGTGTGAIANGLARIIKNIKLRTSADGVLMDASGVSFQRRLERQIHTALKQTTLAASNGVYNFCLDIMFYNPTFRRPEDSLLNTSRYKSVELAITYGGLADLFTSVGTATLATALDVYIYKSEFNVTASNAPNFLPYFVEMPTKLFQAADAYIDLEKDEELVVTQLIVGMTDNTGSAGIPFSGAETTVETSIWSIEDNSHPFLFDRLSMAALMSDTKTLGELETPGAGIMIFNMIDDNSAFSAYTTGDKSKFRIKWDRNGSVATNLITVCVDGLKYLDVPEHGVMLVQEQGAA